MTTKNKAIFNAYVRYMVRAAKAFNRSHLWELPAKRQHYWCKQYFKYLGQLFTTKADKIVIFKQKPETKKEDPTPTPNP